MRRHLLALVIVTGGCDTCVGSPGTIAGARSDASFVTEPGSAYVSTGDGIWAISLDGATKKRVLAPGHSVLDVSTDLGTFVANDADTNLFIGSAATGSWKRVPELDGRVSDAAISPDGSRIVASRHGDFDKKPTKDDDTLYLIDVATGKVEILTATTDHWPTHVAWSADGKSVFAQMAFEQPSQWVVIATKTRTDAKTPPETMHDSPANRGARCPSSIVHDKWGTEVSVRDAAGKTVVVVSESGRKRGFHDHDDDFWDPRFTPKCGYVAFGRGQELWLADATGNGDVGPLISGSLLFFGPPL